MGSGPDACKAGASLDHLAGISGCGCQQFTVVGMLCRGLCRGVLHSKVEFEQQTAAMAILRLRSRAGMQLSFPGALVGTPGPAL